MKRSLQTLTLTAMLAASAAALAMPMHAKDHKQAMRAHQPSILLMNTSTHHRPMHLSYQVAQKLPGGHWQVSQPYHTTLKHKQRLDFGQLMHQHPQATIAVMPVSINGHPIPAGATHPIASRNHCSIAINQHHRHGALMLTLSPMAHGHHRLTCSKIGGIRA